MIERIRHIVRKEFIQAFREPRMRVLLFLPPLVQLTIFGYAVNMDVERVRLGWMDEDRTPETLELRHAFEGSGRFSLLALTGGEDAVQEALDRGRVQAIVRLAPGFSRQMRRGDTAPVQILVDGTNSNTASIIANYATEIVSRYGADRMQERIEARLVPSTMAAGAPVLLRAPSLAARSRVWFNPDLRSRNYFVPGVVVNIITLVTLMLTALAVVREKELGTMEQLMVTPIRPLELMLGKTLPFALIGLFDLALVSGAALLIFQVPFRGRGVVLLASAVLFLFSTLGVGLFLSTVSQTQQQAMMASFFFFAPAFMLSGFAFPIRNMPEPVQWLTLLNPVRYFLEIVRGVFLKGSGFAQLWPQMLALAAFGAAILVFSALRFHKRLD